MTISHVAELTLIEKPKDEIAAVAMSVVGNPALEELANEVKSKLHKALDAI